MPFSGNLTTTSLTWISNISGKNTVDKFRNFHQISKLNFNCFRPVYIIVLGLLITLSQILFLGWLSGANHLTEAYLKLCQWDSGWYTNIIENGYRSTIPPVRQNPNLSNVAFFPGYPIMVGAFKNFFGLPTPYALLLVAQLTCWGFWIYLFMFFQRWQVSTRLAIGGAIAILVHPAAFYLVAGYSESLFLMALLGFLYWTNYTRFSSWFLAALHGFVMTATRIVGLPLALYPLFIFLNLSVLNKAGNLSQKFRKNISYLLISVISSLGCVFFFIFCYLEFGDWALYMKTQLTGWGIKPNYLAFLHSKNYISFVFAQNLTNFVNQLSVPVTMVLLLIFCLAELRLAKIYQGNWQQRVGFYFCGWIMFYLSACSLESRGMASMIRYTFCVHVMLVLAVVHLLSKVQPTKAVANNWVAFLMLFMGTASFLMQSKLAYMFTHGEWVA